jgi:hypothetical protein
MGIKDTTFVCSFDKKDLPSLYELAEMIRNTHSNDLIDDFNTKCQKKIDDHNPILEIGNQKIEFEQVAKADDLVVTVGINQCLDQILGVSVVRWQYVGIGTGSTSVSAAQTALTTEVLPRADMSLSGWREPFSSCLKFAGIFGESHSNAAIREAAVFTASGGGTMLNRNIFTNLVLSTSFTSATMVSAIIEFVPVMT